MKITVQRNLPDGITTTVQEPIHDPVQFYHGTNPFSFINIADGLDKIKEFFNSATILESTVHASRENITCRSNVSVQPNIPQLGQVSDGFNETRVGYSIINTATTSESSRLRSRFQIPLGLLIWIPCMMIAFHPKRDSLFNLVQEGQQVPSILSQLSLKVRNSKVPQAHYHVSGSYSFLPQEFIDVIKDTFFDKDFVTSESGFIQFMSFCNWLQCNPGNYIKFEALTQNNRSKLLSRLESGHQVTFGSLDCHPVDGTYLLTRIVKRPNSSFSDVIKDTHFIDCATAHCRHFMDKGLTQPFARNAEFVSFYIDHNSSQNYHAYILERCTGGIVNDFGSSNPDVDLPQQKEDNGGAKKAPPASASPKKQQGKRPFPSKKIIPLIDSISDIRLDPDLIKLFKLLISNPEIRNLFKNLNRIFESNNFAFD